MESEFENKKKVSKPRTFCAHRFWERGPLLERVVPALVLGTAHARRQGVIVLGGDLCEVPWVPALGPLNIPASINSWFGRTQ